MTITEADWIGIRMVYLLLAYDPSAASHPEVKRAMDWYENKYAVKNAYSNTEPYAAGFWLPIFDRLRQDNGWRNTFNETGSDLNRRLASGVTIHYKDQE